ncbi:MAG: uroporphyrinogen decarboxylase [Bacteroidota bacterium]
MTNSNSILKRTLRGEATERPPVWFMRQAGRILPRYRALKESYTFRELMRDPQLAADVTLMPIDDLGVDAAIMFSDILVIPQALGLDVHFHDTGPEFSKSLLSSDSPSSLLKADTEKLEYIYDVIDAIQEKKDNDTALIGFCGSPFTVLLYMLQGFHKKSDFPDAIEFIYKNPQETERLLHIITDISIEYMSAQIDHDIDMFQLFDTHAGLIPFNLYTQLVLPHVTRIAQKAREKEMPFVFFPKGIGVGLRELTPEHGDFVSIDWQTPLDEARRLLHPDIGVQGNIDPRLLYASEDDICKTLESYKAFGKTNHNWIFNLGHGFMPGLSDVKAKFIVDWVKGADWGR